MKFTSLVLLFFVGASIAAPAINIDESSSPQEISDIDKKTSGNDIIAAREIQPIEKIVPSVSEAVSIIIPHETAIPKAKSTAPSALISDDISIDDESIRCAICKGVCGLVYLMTHP